MLVRESTLGLTSIAEMTTVELDADEFSGMSE